MTINLSKRLYTLREAVNLFPKQPNGKPINLATLYRYTTTGLRGVILASVQAGNTRAVTEDAVAAFFEELTRQKNNRSKVSAGQPAAETGERLRRTVFNRSRKKRRPKLGEQCKRHAAAQKQGL
jgi:predicted transcriptional regulator